MFVFGHLGIGNKLASPWSRNLPKVPLFLGMLFPDLIDKPLYYGNLFLKHHYGIFWDMVSCTRTFGHTGLLLAIVVVIAGVTRSRWFGALGLGMATHLLLDCLIDRFFPGASSAVMALGWPVTNRGFAVFWFDSIQEHGQHLMKTPILVSEIIGVLLIGWDYWKSANRGEMKKVLFS